MAKSKPYSYWGTPMYPAPPWIPAPGGWGPPSPRPPIITQPTINAPVYRAPPTAKQTAFGNLPTYNPPTEIEPALPAAPATPTTPGLPDWYFGRDYTDWSVVPEAERAALEKQLQSGTPDQKQVWNREIANRLSQFGNVDKDKDYLGTERSAPAFNRYGQPYGISEVAERGVRPRISRVTGEKWMPRGRKFTERLESSYMNEPLGY